MTIEMALALKLYLAGLHPNLRAWGDMLGVSEGTKTCPITKDDGYDVIVAGLGANGKVEHEVFTDYSTHPFCNGRPAKVVSAKGLRSTAAGKFQLLGRYWPPYKLQLRLLDFGPVPQFQVMVQLVKECHALDDITTGHLTRAVGKCASRWASLPGNDYGQHQFRMDVLEEVFERAGGTFA